LKSILLWRSILPSSCSNHSRRTRQAETMNLGRSRSRPDSFAFTRRIRLAANCGRGQDPDGALAGRPAGRRSPAGAISTFPNPPASPPARPGTPTTPAPWRALALGGRAQDGISALHSAHVPPFSLISWEFLGAGDHRKRPNFLPATRSYAPFPSSRWAVTHGASSRSELSRGTLPEPSPNSPGTDRTAGRVNNSPASVS